MNGSISQEQKDLVDVLTLETIDVILELLEERSEVRWASESDLWECLSVSGDHVLDSDNFWLSRVAVYSETVIDCVDSHVAWNSTESKAWECLVTIIWLKDRAN